MLDRRLYLPQAWVEDEAYAERRAKCGVPKEVAFQTKPTLATEMIKAAHTAGTLPFRWLTLRQAQGRLCDEAFGRDTTFLDSVTDLVWYFAEVPKDTRVWLERPQIAVPEWSGHGRKPTREKLVSGEPNANEVHIIAAQLAAEKWIRHTIKEGSKGTIIADFAMLRVVAVRDGLPGPDVWLVFRRDPASVKSNIISATRR